MPCKNRILKMFTMIFFMTATLVMGNSFKVDRAHSSVKFKVKCLVVGSVTGKFSHFDGYFELEDKKIKSFNAKCKTNSINTGNRKRDKNLKSAYFFNAKSFPNMTLQMIKLKKNRMIIKLTIKGITKLVAFSYKPVKSSKAQENNNRANFQIEGKIYLKDFDLNIKKAVGPASVVLGKTVKIVANIEGKEIYDLEKYINTFFDDVKEIFSPR